MPSDLNSREFSDLPEKTATHVPFRSFKDARPLPTDAVRLGVPFILLLSCYFLFWVSAISIVRGFLSDRLERGIENGPMN